MSKNLWHGVSCKGDMSSGLRLPIGADPTDWKEWIRIMKTETQVSAPCLPSRESRGWLILLKALVAYFAVSTLTLPVLNALWLGELPVLALVQLPKTVLAGWLRTEVAMPALRAMGLSRGSFSPDYMLVRPYALAIAYLIPLGLVLAPLWIRTRLARSYRRWVWILLAAAMFDYCLTLLFASTRGLTIY